MEKTLVKRDRINIIGILLICLFLTGCYSTTNSESIGTLKIQENKETSTYLLFGFGIIKVTKPADEDISIIRNYGTGLQVNQSSKTEQGFSFGIWSDKTTTIKPDSNTIHEIKENVFSDEIKVQKVQ